MNRIRQLAVALSDTNGDGRQYDNWSLTKAPTSFDTRHRFILIPTYELPVGKGRKFCSGGGWEEPFLGGWNLSLIYMILSGAPVTFSFAGSPLNYLPGGPTRPNQISDSVAVDGWAMRPNRFPTSAQNPLYNQKAFAYPAAYQHGTLGTGTAYGLWQYWAQSTLSKTLIVRERVRFSVRLDGNNIPVRAQFTSPNTTVNFSTAAEPEYLRPLRSGGNQLLDPGDSEWKPGLWRPIGVLNLTDGG